MIQTARTRQARDTWCETGHEPATMPRMPDRLLITKGEVAERLSVSVRTIERLVSTGRLPQVYVEHSARFRVKDLEAYVNGLTETQSGDRRRRKPQWGALTSHFALDVVG